jgi:hypothetical protein
MFPVQTNSTCRANSSSHSGPRDACLGASDHSRTAFSTRVVQCLHYWVNSSTKRESGPVRTAVGLGSTPRNFPSSAATPANRTPTCGARLRGYAITPLCYGSPPRGRPIWPCAMATTVTSTPTSTACGLIRVSKCGCQHTYTRHGVLSASE